MDWQSPKLVLLALPCLALLLWIESQSVHPMQGLRKRWLLLTRSAVVVLTLLALAGPARVILSEKQTVVFIVDHSQSMGPGGLRRALEQAASAAQRLPGTTTSYFIALGDEPALIPAPVFDDSRVAWQRQHGTQTQLQTSLDLARSLFPAGSGRHIVVISDGHQTQGSAMLAAQSAATTGEHIFALPVAGDRQPDVRAMSLQASRGRVHEGATVQLRAVIDATMDATAELVLYENKTAVDQRRVELKAGQTLSVAFDRTPLARETLHYRVDIQPVTGETLPNNNSAQTLIEVRGKTRLLMVDSQPAESQTFAQAMIREGLELEVTTVSKMPRELPLLAGYDGIILSDVPATQIGTPMLEALRQYVERLGGGLIMIGGPNSYGVGGYVGSPLEPILPVKLATSDQEEQQSSALAIVIDRSGSMMGEKLAVAKSSAVAAAQVLKPKDSITVLTFDSQVQVVVPMTPVTSMDKIKGQILSITSGGGTDLDPAFREARTQLDRTLAKIKHLIILTDGQTSGAGYEQFAAQCQAVGITISTVAIGEGSHVGLLYGIASAGGGQAYNTSDLDNITRIFTQDTLLHTGRMIEEKPFGAIIAEQHPMISDLADIVQAPPLQGYVRTTRRITAQTPLTTPTGDPLLAQWRFGLGKVTAFTSDAKTRWSSRWMSDWKSWPQLWSQILRDTARPPQGHRMDVQTVMQDGVAQITVDLMTDAATRANDASITADVFQVGEISGLVPLTKMESLSLAQTGPGLYAASYRPTEPGLYVVRALAGGDLVSTTFAHQQVPESSAGTTNDLLLAKLCATTNGRVLSSAELPDLQAYRATEHEELWPWIVLTLLLLFMVDTAIRRWEHVLAIAELARSQWSRLRV
jgi:Ca-activated chloride channel homolog